VTDRGPEQVLVVPRAVLMDDPGWYGLRPTDAAAFESLVARHGEFRDRPAMEADRSFKQVIPYLVVRDGSRYFLMRRTRAGGDPRLHDRWSIGVGGHLNPGDMTLAGGLRREWLEELDAELAPEFRLVGLLNDDTTEVGSVHVGAVYVADAGGWAERLRVRETDKLEGAFATPAGVAAVADRLETWSRIVFEHLEGAASAS
jgi:predicted NUDIX family phosphoesterase